MRFSFLTEAGLLLLFVAIFVFAIWWTLARGRSILEEWAQQNRVDLLDYEYKWWSRGPFWWTTSKNQSVYRITVRDELGNVQSGWARVGSWWWGLFERKVEVRWDDEGKEKRKEKVKNG